MTWNPPPGSGYTREDFLGEGPECRPSPVRHDPTGHEDCGMNWDPCTCHGDRLCLLGKKMKWMRDAAEHAAWLRGEREDEVVSLQMAGCSEQWELDLKARRSQEMADELASEAWPQIVACAREDREHMQEVAYDAANEREQERRWG